MAGIDERQIHMRIGGLVVDPNTKAPIVVLRGVDDERLYLPIYIGGAEASAIAAAISEIELPRPMTHDLITNILGLVGITLQKVTIIDLVDGTYYAELTLTDDQGHCWEVDSRPSDALALALRSGAEILVAQKVVEEAGGIAEDETDEGLEEGAEEENGAAPIIVSGEVDLEDLDPDDFGSYEM
jgi:bifunctional DNase/RNase